VQIGCAHFFAVSSAILVSPRYKIFYFVPRRIP
jgi:hypothetical protein